MGAKAKMEKRCRGEGGCTGTRALALHIDLVPPLVSNPTSKRPSPLHEIA
jgi:hypothetical protein